MILRSTRGSGLLPSPSDRWAMGDLDKDTSVKGGDGLYRASLSEEWEIWGPQGGYVASVALRAAGAHSPFPRPASFFCHFVNVGSFGEVEIRVETLRRSRRAESMRVALLQQDRVIMEALVWTVDRLSGLDHLDAPAPEVSKPAETKSWGELYADDPGPPFRFWYNLEGRPVGFDRARASQPGRPFTQTWMRFIPTPTFDDPFVDAGRILIIADVSMFPAAVRAHGGEGPPPYVAPSMDLGLAFHDFAPDSEWLLIEAESPIAKESLVGGRATVWSEDGRLLATGVQQMLQRLS